MIITTNASLPLRKWPTSCGRNFQNTIDLSLQPSLSKEGWRWHIDVLEVHFKVIHQQMGVVLRQEAVLLYFI